MRHHDFFRSATLFAVITVFVSFGPAAEGQSSSDTAAPKAISYAKLGYTNRGLCPSKYILRNSSRNAAITVTIKYSFTRDIRFRHTLPSPETEIIFVAPGQTKELKYQRKQCGSNGVVGAKIVGAYFGR